MKLTICDICKHKDGEVREADYRRGYKGWSKIDTCAEHKDYPMGDTPQEFSQKYLDMVYGKNAPKEVA